MACGSARRTGRAEAGEKEIKRQIQLADDIIKEDLYTAYYAVSKNEEIVADRDVEIPGMEENTAVEKGAGVVVEPDINVEVMNSNNIQNDIPVMSDIHNVSDVNMARMDEDITDVTGKSKLVEPKEKNLWIKLAGLSGEYQSLVVMRMSVILLRLIYSDLILLILVEA